ncbi:hypothetical protein BT69DRAFT_1295484 [Atractiella rhizophila]|nr:hypothetical protein BT69DRAFT_1295484 [Atractiella rhizophila]
MCSDTIKHLSRSEITLVGNVDEHTLGISGNVVYLRLVKEVERLRGLNESLHMFIITLQWKANTLGEAAEDSADLDQDLYQGQKRVKTSTKANRKAAALSQSRTNVPIHIKHPVNMDFFTKDLSLDCLQEELEGIKGYYAAGKSLKSRKLKDLEGVLSMDQSLIRLDNIPAISNLLLSMERSDEQSQLIGTFKSPVHLFDLATKIEVAQTVESTAHILFRFAKYVQLSFRRRIHH